MKVSVVVPVFNPGRDIDDCIASVLGQSLPTTDYEAIFVDDGSTDDTPARLDALAAEHQHIRVIHIPNSGWPGKPRNVGIDHARGTFVQLVDQDDRLAPDALRRLVEMGEQNGSDIVIGRVTSDFRGVPIGLFARDRDACTIYDAPLIDSLTPHKMFRRAFLDQHEIRFPEGPYILEDQLFMVRCYFRATVVSILASYPCYFYQERSDQSNAASRPINPPVYYRNLRDVMDVVIANTEPGPFRDGLLRRSYRVEMLGRVGDPVYPGLDPALRESIVTNIRSLARDHVNDDVHARLTPVLRARSAIIRDERPDAAAADALTDLARRTGEAQVEATLDRLGWDGGRCAMTFRVESPDGADQRSIRFVRRGERTYLDSSLTDGLLPDPVDVTDDLPATRVWVSLRHTRDLVEWRVSAKHGLELLDEAGGTGDERWLRPVLRVDASFAPATIAGGGPLADGEWDVRVRVVLAGFDRRIAIGDPSATERVAPEPGWLDGRRVVRWSTDEVTGVHVTIQPGDLSTLIGSVRAEPSGGRNLVIALPIRAGGLSDEPITAFLRDGAADRPVKASLRSKRGRLEVTVTPGWRPGILRRRRSLVLMPDGPDGSEIVVGTVQTDWNGRSFLDGARRVGLVASTGHHAKAVARRIARRMPGPVKRLGRRLLGRARRG